MTTSAQSAAGVRPTGAGDQRVGTLTSLRNRDFRFLLAGTMAMQIGTWAQTVGQGWLIHELTHSAVQLGLIAFVRGVVMLVAGPFAGVIADLMERRRVVIGGTLIAAGNATVLALLAASGHIAVWHLYALAAADGLLNAVNQPARQALVYDVSGKEEVTNAVALMSVGQNIMRILGPAVAGALIGVIGLAACFVFQAVCYGVAASLSVWIRVTQRRGAGNAGVLDNLLGGFRYARRNRTVLLLLLVSAVPSLLVYPYVGFMPVFASDVWHVDAFRYGVLMTAIGFGSIPGSFIAASITHVPNKGRLMILTGASYTTMVAAFALSPWYGLAFACLVVAGLTNPVQNTFNAALLQLRTADEFRGRVSSLYFMTFGLVPLGSLAMGGLIARLGAPLTVAAFALLATALSLLLLAGSRTIRAL